MGVAVGGTGLDGQNRVGLEVADSNLSRLLSYVASSAGWSVCSNPSPDDPVVTDVCPPAGAGRTVLVVRPTPFAAAEALDAVLSLDAAAVLCSDTPDALPSTLDGLSNDTVAVPSRVLRLAREMPQLTDRQMAIMVGVVAGRSNAELARDLCVSTASVKRELADLYRVCGASNRASLAARGYELGLARVADGPDVVDLRG